MKESAKSWKTEPGLRFLPQHQPVEDLRLRSYTLEENSLAVEEISEEVFSEHLSLSEELADNLQT